MSSNGVEVPQRNRQKVGVRFGVVLHNLFNHCFSLTIGVQRLDFVVLLARRIFAIHTGTAREYIGTAVVCLHELQKGDGATHVVLVVVERLADGLTYSLKSSVVDDSYWFILSKYFVHRLTVPHINFLEWNIILP